MKKEITDGDVARAELNCAGLRGFAPWTAGQLARYVKLFTGLSVPGVSLCAGHSSPLEYLWYVYSVDKEYKNSRTQELRNSRTQEHKDGANHGQTAIDRVTRRVVIDSGRMPELRYNGDCIVWANRGGGKTQLAAIATLLEGIFKPRCQTRILGGSLEQSGRMYAYLCEILQNGYEDFVDGRVLKESCRFVNAASAAMVAQSSRAVRGQHIHKLRCDEVELFDPQVLKAAAFITQSTHGLVGAMEMLSTMHRPYGLMQQVIDASASSGIPVFKWCLWEVIEPCPPDRSCSRCPLWSDCGGRARRAVGYFKIDDTISQMRRSSRAGFEAEMLCLRPNLENAVFADFDPTVHVKPVGYDPALALYRAMDFGFTNPFVCLWIQVDSEGIVRVFDEYVQDKKIIAEHGKTVIRRTPCPEDRVAATYCDPAGNARNGVSGTSEVKALRDMGMKMKYCKSEILEGIEKIRAALRAGDGVSRLVINPKCTRLIEAMRCYHYPEAAVPGELPEKDGVYDHPIDALRYFFVNWAYSGKPSCKQY